MLRSLARAGSHKHLLLSVLLDRAAARLDWGLILPISLLVVCIRLTDASCPQMEEYALPSSESTGAHEARDNFVIWSTGGQYQIFWFMDAVLIVIELIKRANNSNQFQYLVYFCFVQCYCKVKRITINKSVFDNKESTMLRNVAQNSNLQVQKKIDRAFIKINCTRY